MKLIVDTNRIIAALVKDSFSRRLLRSDCFQFYTIAQVREEISKYEYELLPKARVSASSFRALLNTFLERVSFVDDARIQQFMPQARAVLDPIDPKDTPFLAAALAIGAGGIWSHDPHFTKQNLVNVFNTDDLLALL